jgi:hypothetical protein
LWFILRRYQYLDYTAPDGQIMNLKEFGSGIGLIELLSRHLSRGTEVNNEDPKSEQPVSRLRFEPSKSRIQAYSVTVTLTCSVEFYSSHKWLIVRKKPYVIYNTGRRVCKSNKFYLNTFLYVPHLTSSIENTILDLRFPSCDYEGRGLLCYDTVKFREIPRFGGVEE